MPSKPPDEHTGNVFFPDPITPPCDPNEIDKIFLGYGGSPEAVGNWQAIALTAVHVFAKTLQTK